MSGNAQRRRAMRDLAKRDAAFENNNCWDQLESLYVDCVTVLLSWTNLSTVAKDTELLGYLANPQSTINNLSILNRDLQQLSQEVAQIHEHHAGKTGGAADADEMMHSITIFEHYKAFMDRHDGIVMPTGMQISEQFDKANQRRLTARAAAERQAQAQNPTDGTVIDTPFREVGSAEQPSAAGVTVGDAPVEQSNAPSISN